jgi:LacI family transcriptional regulator
MAAGVIRVAHRRGIRIPAQLSVAGFDDIPLAQQVYPSLTTIKQPLEGMAEKATELLINEIRGYRSAAGPGLVPSKIIVRDSTGPIPAS